jgi:hypothetical protein
LVPYPGAAGKSNRRTHAFAWVPAPMNADKNAAHRRSSAFIGGCLFYVPAVWYHIQMPDELSELQEHAEAGHDPELRRVSLSMAVIAVLVAAVGLLSHRAHTAAILEQSKASDQWNYMQAKDIRRHTYNLFADLLDLAPPTGADGEKRQAKREGYIKQAEKYKDDVAEINKEATALEHERDIAEHRADRFDAGEVLLEISLVLASVTLMTRKNAYWIISLTLAVAGAVIAATGFLVN